MISAFKNLGFIIICFCFLERTVFSKLLTLIPDTPFVSIWNSPSKICQARYGVEFNLSYFDIIANRNDTFEGNEIVIFYGSKLGLYPWIDDGGTPINGGVPQLADLDNHLQKVSEDVSRFIPNKTFSGLAVIDWESWRPIFDRNGYNDEQKIYIRVSENLVRTKHPDWSDEEIKNEARIEFEKAAMKFMQNTLEACRRLRPRGYWGYYGFPNCYNDKEGEKQCANDTIRYNNRLWWMFNASTAIFPSIYLQERFGTHEDRYERVYGSLKEALRVQHTYGDPFMPVIAYTKYKYADTEAFYDREDLKSTIQQSANAGLNAIALWDSSTSFRSKDECEAVRDYVDSVLGPFVKNLTTAMTECSRTRCHLHGRCVSTNWQRNSAIKAWQNDHSFLQWLLFIFRKLFSGFDLGNDHVYMHTHVTFSCQCYKGWTGTYCENSVASHTFV